MTIHVISVWHINEITKNAIQEAFKNPSRLDTNKVNAQQARRFLDRVVGFMISPLLWEKIARGLWAGRVQSVAVKLVVERERDVRAFFQRNTGKSLQIPNLQKMTFA